MIYFLRELFLMTKRKAVMNIMRKGYRVMLWKHERGDNFYDEKKISITMPGTSTLECQGGKLRGGRQGTIYVRNK